MDTDYETDLAAEATECDIRRLEGLIDRLDQSLKDLGEIELLSKLIGYMRQDIAQTVKELDYVHIRLTNPVD